MFGLFFKARKTDVAVAARVFLEILLVILLGRDEISKLLHVGCNGIFVFFLLCFDHAADDRQVGVVNIINTAPVLGAFIGPLTVDGCRVDHREEMGQKLL
ncbi:hypothetical protein SDC9_201198 [bioreactor metagenome]|uniref:Uncharacterized protein n=1 Tax=bioreactor metagenome TaxID=1076179 RepID=A0A645IZ55_9ZZZZ